MNRFINLLKALSDSNRLKICAILMEKPLCVCEITSLLGMANSTISEHLSVLRKNNLVVYERDGKWINYKFKWPDNQTEKMIIMQIIEYSKTDREFSELVKKTASVDREIICSR